LPVAAREGMNIKFYKVSARHDYLECADGHIV
jgi:hypothetical protein